MTFWFSDCPRIASFGPKLGTMGKNGEETAFLSDNHVDSEMFTFEIEEKGAENTADKAVIG